MLSVGHGGTAPSADDSQWLRDPRTEHLTDQGRRGDSAMPLAAMYESALDTQERSLSA